MWAFQRPHRVARIYANTDEVFSSAFDQRLQLPRLHIPRVVLNGDFNMGIHYLVANVFENLNCVLDVSLERNLALSASADTLFLATDAPSKEIRNAW